MDDTPHWLNEPPQWHEDGDRLTAVTGPETDFWRETHYGFIHDNGHARLTPVPGDFTAEVAFEADYTTLYDQAGLMLRLDERNWLKAGVEFVDQQLTLGAVVTRETSDWSAVPGVAAPTRLRLRITRQGTAVSVAWAPDVPSARFRMLRLTWLPAGPAAVGPMLCTPKRAGLEVRFDAFTIGPASGEPLYE